MSSSSSSFLLRVSDFCKSESPSPRVPVTVQTTTIHRTRAAGGGDGRGGCCAVGWVDGSVLIALSHKEGDYACLSFGSRKIMLRLYLDESTNIMDEEESWGSCDYHHHPPADGFPLGSIHVPPITARNLGDPNEKDDVCILETVHTPPTPAGMVLLRPFGRNPIWPRLESISQSNGVWSYPVPNTLVEIDQLLSVYDTTKDHVCYYQVMNVTLSADAPAPSDGGHDHGDKDHHRCYYVITNSTIFQLDDSPLQRDHDVPKLPCLLSQKYYFQAHNVEFKLPPHPDIPALTLALNLTASSHPTERILHIVGTDRDHDLSLAVEMASHHVGRTCWTLRGLAAFAHSMGQKIRSGSLVDQLTGLDAALDEIRDRRLQPCVLHLHCIDDELSGGGDDSIRREQEQRLWAKILLALSQTSDYIDFANDTTTTAAVHSCSTCPLIVVLSSSKPLKAGPWLETLVFPSIRLSLPNPDYTRHLWNDAPWDDEMDKILRGRGCSELRKVQAAIKSMDNEMEARKTVLGLCRSFDEQRRRQRSAAVAQVHWEDVGGLAHVRDEIMDAIELPLKYPHLFSGGKGRTGILLYGPPGTGKTLVAKAVATECGLPFMSVKGPELLGSYVGESEANVRAVFQSARDAAEQNTPVFASILFFDELDSLAPKRGGVGDGGGVMERVVATLLAELDTGAPSKSRVFVIGATNRPDLLDPSLLRPGRLDRTVYLGISTDEDERARILAAQLQRLKLDGNPMEMSRAVVTKLPPRLTGADFSTIASGALLLAVERLCRKADEEQKSSSNELGREIDLHEILQAWDEEKCTPTILMKDILKAAENVVPSVSEEELTRYERLRVQYNATGETAPIEHEGDVFYQAEL